MGNFVVNLWTAKVAIRATFPYCKFLNVQIAIDNNFVAYLAPSMLLVDSSIAGLIETTGICTGLMVERNQK